MAKVPAARRKSAVGAGVAGASGGTSLLAWVNSIPDTNHWKPFLVFASPTIAVILSGMWMYGKERLDVWAADRGFDAEIRKAEATLRMIEADQQTSERLKKEARNKVEALRKLKLDLHSNRAQAIVEA